MRGFTGTIAIYCSVKRWKRKKIGKNEGKKSIVLIRVIQEDAKKS